jgi:hypothetical protein
MKLGIYPIRYEMMKRKIVFLQYILQQETNSMKFQVFQASKIHWKMMGVLNSVSAYARPSAWNPIDMSGNFQVHVSAESPSNISLNSSEVISGTLA